MAAQVLHSEVLDALTREIVGGELQSGAVLTLERIQQRFAVSRTVARECMRMLEQLQLVTSRRRVGIVVRPREDWDVLSPRVIRCRLDGSARADQLRSLSELRRAVEPVAAASAARLATPVERARVLELGLGLRQLGEAGRLEEFLERDIAFHGMLLRASHNEMFAALTDAIAEVLAGRTRHGLMPLQPEPEALDAHEAVARAVHDGDSAAAEHWMGILMAELRGAMDDA